MKQYTFILSLLFILVCFLSCSSRESSEKTDAIILQFDEIGKKNISIDNIQYIPLETTEQSLIGSINKILYRNEQFYILDKTQNKSIYTFDKNGKFLSILNKEGNGPGEYVEIMDMDIDNDRNIYVSDNANMQIIKYIKGNPDQYEIIKVGEHFMEFCYLNNETFVLSDLFDKEGQKMKLALFNSKKKSITPLLTSKSDDINELSILRCSKHYLYRSDNNILYNNRFSPNIYSIKEDGTLSEILQIASNKYIPRSNLKELEKSPMKFMQEKTYIKDIISIYESSDYFVCMPFITPLAEFLVIPKKNGEKAIRMNFMDEPLLQGISTIETVAENKFVTFINYSEKQEERQRNNPILKEWNEESNPVLILFKINKI